MTKLLQGLSTTIQINLLELRGHYKIIRNSKVIHILGINIFFIISLENGSKNLSLILNDIIHNKYYLFNLYVYTI